MTDLAQILTLEAQLTALIPQLGVSLGAGIGNDGHLERAIEYGAMELEDALGNVEGERARDRDERNLNYWPADDVAQARDVLHWAWRALGLTVREPHATDSLMAHRERGMQADIDAGRMPWRTLSDLTDDRSKAALVASVGQKVAAE